MTSLAGRVGCVMLGLVVAVQAGCGEKPLPEPPTGSVSGTVKYKGNPVAKGRVAFTNLQGGAGSADVNNGTYEIKGLKLGDYKVAVLPPDAQVPQDVMDKYMKGEIKELPKPDAADIPEKYRKVETSNLTTAIKEGSQTFDIPLE